MKKSRGILIFHSHAAATAMPSPLSLLPLWNVSASGDAGGADTHTHLYDVTDGGENMPGTGGNFSFSTGDQRTTEPADSLPTYYEVVWVMRVR